MKRITLGTRGSKLAMIQTNRVVELLRQQWPTLEISIERISTRGDRIQDAPLSQLGGDGVFVTEIERALHEGRIDLAVHSLKDLPTAQPDGLYLTTAGAREDVRDVFVFRHPPVFSTPHPASGEKESLACHSERSEESAASPSHDGSFRILRCAQNDTPGGVFIASHNGRAAEPYSALFSLPRIDREDVVETQTTAPMRVGTCSLRRTAQVKALYPDAQILSLRGNVDTRLRKLDAGEYDCIVLASAGLHRLRLQEQLANRLVYLPVDSMMPAPGQGALALEMRDEPELRQLVTSLCDPAVQAATSAERMFMRRLGAGCYLPVAAYGEVLDKTLSLRGLVTSLDGSRQVRVEQSIYWTPATGIEQAGQLGIVLAEQALARGADAIIESLNSVRTPQQQEQHYV